MWYDGSETSEKQAESLKPGWPPKFEEYAEYERELNDAIRLHPPFGGWLRNYRHVENCVSEDSHDFGMWKLTVDELKERYVKQETLKRREAHARRVVAEEYEVNVLKEQNDQLQIKIDELAIAAAAAAAAAEAADLRNVC